MGDGFLTILKTRAVIIKTQDIRENDKIVWLFTEELGKISTIVRGAKKTRNKLFSATLQFCYGDYILYRGKKFYIIDEGSIIDSFQNLLGDLDTLTYASYFCELIDIAMEDHESSRFLFVNLVTALYLMKNNAVDMETLARAFELKILEATGYGINFENCAICRKKINTSNYLSMQYLGGICDECEKTGGLPVKNASFNALKYISKIPLEKVYRINLSREIKGEIYGILKLIISQNYFRKPKSLETLNYISSIKE
ncbi:MAG: DNA repair protein RecO [Clostridium sp.]|uniref:DNA repair protein RecO n=1 Tax=Clostridium sp. TaxID=1506 RepID=UPI0025BFF6BC|nr:DNA repair protein RecO [Clostridium sp.]MCH3964679.1 DNA repair protein RecO [Clostridium sp.]MCI1715150.1 DNA repair protein RecO [Clostridium sp.]MCI1799412.1 DNA repair protein RecO [Clostridium sp.]MCI1813333.1 DNA repair protein RecO [Clostridium sp.]MCI1870224.1 DNA repair protein RecO [Clostridium sp.]